MSRIAPPPSRTTVLDQLGNFSTQWLAWLRSIRVAADSGVDVGILEEFASINRPAPEDPLLEVFGMPEAPAAPQTLDTGESSQWPAYFADLEQLAALERVDRHWSEIAIVADTAANATLYPAAAYVPGSLRFETDTEKLFMQIGGTWVQLIAPALLQFLGTTASFPALKRSGTILQVRLADDSDYSALEVLDEAYGSGWNGKVEVPTKNAIYDLAPAEGLWTPGVSFGGGTVGITYSSQLGRYQVLGDFVFFVGSFNLTSKGSSAGGAFITGLPFSSKNENLSPAVAINLSNMAGTAGGFQAIQNSNSTFIQPFYTNTGTPSWMDDTNFTNSSNLFVSGIYRRA